jgi:hypothetical protein
MLLNILSEVFTAMMLMLPVALMAYGIVKQSHKQN